MQEARNRTQDARCIVQTTLKQYTYMLVGADDDPAEVSVHHLGSQPSQAPHQLLEELGHQSVDHAVQQRVRQQPVAVPAQVAVHVVQDRVSNTSGAIIASDVGRGGRGGYFFDAFGDHCLEDAVGV